MPATRGSKKDSDWVITPEVKEVCVPAHLALPGSPQAKHLCHLHAQLSLGQSCHRQKSLESMHTGSLRSCLTLCNTVDCGLPGFSVREGGSPGKNTGGIVGKNMCVLVAQSCSTLGNFMDYSPSMEFSRQEYRGVD